MTEEALGHPRSDFILKTFPGDPGKAGGGSQDPRTGFLGCAKTGFLGEGQEPAGPAGCRGTRGRRLPPRLLGSWLVRRGASVSCASTPYPAAPGPSRTLTVRPHREARQTECEQRRRPEPGARAGPLCSHSPGVRGRRVRARARARAAVWLPRHGPACAALCSVRLRGALRSPPLYCALCSAVRSAPLRSSARVCTALSSVPRSEPRSALLPSSLRAPRLREKRRAREAADAGAALRRELPGVLSEASG